MLTSNILNNNKVTGITVPYNTVRISSLKSFPKIQN